MTDKKTFKLLQKADTTGVFQLESGGMKRYLKELKPTEWVEVDISKKDDKSQASIQ